MNVSHHCVGKKTQHIHTVKDLMPDTWSRLPPTVCVLYNSREYPHIDQGVGCLHVQTFMAAPPSRFCSQCITTYVMDFDLSSQVDCEYGRAGIVR